MAYRKPRYRRRRSYGRRRRGYPGRRRRMLRKPIGNRM